MKFIQLFTVLWLGVLQTPVCQADPDVQALMLASDRARAGGLPGLVWDVRATNTGSAVTEVEPSLLRLRAAGSSSLADYMEPIRSKGSRILQVDRNMWFSKNGLRKPVAISPRQRLTGQAAIGDIAATDYSHDYQAKYLREENLTVNLVMCWS